MYFPADSSVSQHVGTLSTHEPQVEPQRDQNLQPHREETGPRFRQQLSSVLGFWAHREGAYLKSASMPAPTLTREDDNADRAHAAERGAPDAASAAADVAEALEGFDNLSDAEKVDALAQATHRLESHISGLDAEQSAQIVDAALKPIEDAIGKIEEYSSQIEQDLVPTWTALAHIGDRVNGAQGGDAIVLRLADMLYASSNGGKFQDLGTVMRPLWQESAGLNVFLRMAEIADVRCGEGATDLFMNEINGSLDNLVDLTTNSVDAYLEHTAELSWMVQNLGTSLSPEQRQAAIDDYIQSQGPEWQARLDTLEQRMAKYGAELLRQFDRIGDLPLGLGSHRTQLEQRIKSLLDNDEVNAAIAAAGGHPELTGELDLTHTIAFLDELKLGNKGLGLMQKLANAQVTHEVLPAIGELDPNDPESVQRVRGQLDELRNAGFAKAWGVDQAQLDRAIDALEDTIPRPGDTEASIQDRLAQYDRRLNGMAQFSAQTPLGQGFRGLGLALGVTGAAASLPHFADDPNVATGLRAFADSAGVITAVGELANGLGWLPDSHPLSRFATNSDVGKLLGSVGIGFGLVGVFDKLGDGDLLRAGIGAAGLGGEALALFGSRAWAGPVGMIIGIGSLLADQIVEQSRTDARKEHLSQASERFLRAAGFNETAARILSLSGGIPDHMSEQFEHYAADAVERVVAYGVMRGLTEEQTVAWINSIGENDLRHVTVNAAEGTPWSHTSQDLLDASLQKFLES